MIAPAAFLEGVEIPPGMAQGDWNWLTVVGKSRSVLDDLPASWFHSKKVTDARSESRRPCQERAWLTSFDVPALNDCAPPVAIVLNDISRQGIGFSHAEPLPFRMVRIAFETNESPMPILTVRLQWCRFRRPGVCESGGQIQRVLLPAIPAGVPIGSELPAAASSLGDPRD